jgi:DNA repair protein SbcC/Rad50
LKLKEQQTRSDETNNNLQSQTEELPANWQEQASLISNTQLQQLEHECQQLVKYEQLAKQLNNAHQSLNDIERQINDLNQQIEQLPLEAHYPSSEIKQNLERAKDERKKNELEKNNAQREIDKLNDKHERRSQLDRDKLQTERDRNLYKKLSELLGKKGIQLHILSNAEKIIIEIANEILDSLSRGKIRLELRKDNEQTNKALDLVAYNYATGDKPTAVALTSGSQRFRIAVSLALAIGQYTQKNGRNIESVIIDEGFGSLDKNGRDDMIQELNELQQRLKRIILVSHQEEFFSAFTNGYKISLVERTSQVSLLESSF